MSLDIDLLGTALKYARRGWPVLPLFSCIEGKCSCGDPQCKSPGKHPRLEGWTKKATTDEAQIRAWFTQWPDSNVAILLGPASGLVAVDIDGKAGSDWIESIDTSEAIIASSGKEFHRHYIFRAPDITVGTKIRIREGVDYLAGNRYLVVEPSCHYSGSVYKFYNLDGKVPGPLPAEILAIVSENTSKPKISELPRANIRSGSRNSTLASLAGAMRRAGFSRDAICAALRETNTERCAPPLDDAEIERIADSIATYEPGSTPPVVLKTIKASELLAREFPPRTWIATGILPLGLGILSGAPKGGKSLLSLQLSTSCAQGIPFLNTFPTTPGSCLFLGLEDDERRLKERAQFYIDPNNKTGLDRLEFATELPRTANGGISLIESWITSKKDPRLIVIDTMGRIRPSPGRNSNMYLEDTSFLAPIQMLALRHQVCILLTHHRRKTPAYDPLDTISGSTGLTGAADACWILNRRDRSRPEATVNIIGRDVESQTLKLFLNESLTWEFRGIDNEPHITPERQEILSTLEQATGPLKTSEIAHKLGKSPSLTSHLLTKLRNEGQVVSPSYGMYALPKTEGESHE